MNILTQEQKEHVEKIYKQKFSIVFLWVLSLVGIIFLIAVAPSYLQLSTQSVLLEEKLATIESSDIASAQEERDLVVSTTNSLLGLFEKLNQSPPVYIEKIVEGFDDVTISEISINYEDRTVSFRGVAKTRQAFVDMTNSLQEAAWAEGVEFPVSNFTRSEDIPFSLSLTLSTDTYGE